MFKKKNITLFAFLLSLQILVIFCQEQIIEKTILLNENEKYFLDLRSMFKQTIQAITLPDSTVNLQSIPPSRVVIKSTTATSMNQVLPASFYVNSNLKNVAAVEKIQNNNQFDYYLVFGQIFMNNGVVFSQELDRLKLFSNTTDTSQIYVSLYSQDSGFATFTYGEYSQNYKFNFSQEQKKLLVGNVITASYLSSLKSIIFNNKIFLISLYQNELQLYQYNEETQKIEIIQRYFGQCSIHQQIHEVNNIGQFYIVQDCNGFISFSFITNENKLFTQNAYVPYISDFKYAFSQLVNKDIFISFLNEQYLIVTKFIVTSENVSLESWYRQKLNQIFTTAVYISNSILQISGEKDFALFDFYESRLIYQQSVDPQLTYTFYNFLNNQLLFTIQNSQTKKYIETQVIQFSSPSFLINGLDQTFNFTINVGPNPILYKGSITVVVVNQPQIQFNAPQIVVGQTYSGQVFQNQAQFSFPIESYITGQNLQLNFQPNDESKNVLSNFQINEIKKIDAQSYTLQINDKTTIFQIEQSPYNSLIVNQQSDNSFILTYLKISSQGSIVSDTPQNQIIDSPIYFVDSQGSFSLQSDANQEQKRIFVPVIHISGNLFMNVLQVSCDIKQQFTFSTDITINTLLIKCGALITQINYLPAFKYPFASFIISTNQIQFDFQQYSNIICLNGYAFIYSSKFILKYNYANQIIYGTPISIPQLNPQQQIQLFAQTFFILYNDSNGKPQIPQYSYQNFQEAQPLQVRTLYIDTTNVPDLTSIPIALRNNNVDNYQYLLIKSSVTPNQFLIYRANNCTSQNQFFGTVNFKTSVSFYSSNFICSFGDKLYCQQILKEAELSLQITQIDSQYSSNIQLPFGFTVSPISNNISGKQVKGILSQDYQFILRRDTSAAYGLVNQQSNSISDLKTSIQDSKNTSQSMDFVLSDGNDPNVYNSNLLGWQLQNSDGNIINRATFGSSEPQYLYTYTILFNQQLTISINSFFINDILIRSNVSLYKCVALEDRSKTVEYDTYTDISIYFICQDYIYFYQINLPKDPKGFPQTGSQFYSVPQQVYAPNQYIGILSISDSDIRLLSINGFQVQLLLDSKSSSAVLNFDLNEQITYMSQNIIQSFNKLILSFKVDGTIYTTFYNSTDINRNGLFNVKNLLKSQNFIVNSDDAIVQVRQISDKVFNIQFANSFIYQITFSFSDQLVLTIQSAYSYDYRDGFSIMMGYIRSGSYDIFVGQSAYNQIIINQYNNNYQQQYCNRIFAWSLQSYNITNYSDVYRIVLTSISSSNTNSFNLYLSNADLLTLKISNSTEISIQQNQFQQQSFSITPLRQNNANNIVSFKYKTKTSGLIQYFTHLLLINLIVFFM